VFRPSSDAALMAACITSATALDRVEGDWKGGGRCHIATIPVSLKMLYRGGLRSAGRRAMTSGRGSMGERQRGSV
jgi:hypothetical protein